jgi:pyruvate/2-oxoglutarate dehydrogenase complex dihydrolipoamide dehydrogenase (E3) component
MTRSHSQNHFDFIVIGGGSAGIPIAHALANSGKDVALIERKHLGGSCINFGCTPTKHGIASAKLAYDSRRSAEFGIEIPTVQVQFDEVVRQAQFIVQKEKKALEKGFQNQPHLTLIGGNARIDGKDPNGNFKIKVENQSLTSKQVILDTGTRSYIPEIEGLDPTNVLNSENWLDQTELPTKIAILGSGYIGLEMGQFYRRMGSKVTLLEPGPRILSREDSDVAHSIFDFLQEEGIQFILNSQLIKVEGGPGKYRLTLNSGVLDVTHLFVATGRKPNTDDLGLDSLGIEILPKGFIPCDSKLATSVKGLWVAGDIRGGPLFTHTAWDDFRILRSQLLEDGRRTTDRIVPYAIFIDPELGRVGMSEQEARTQSKKKEEEPTVAVFQFADSLRAMELRETRGFIKLIVDRNSEEILGAAVLGPMGAELIHLFSTLMSAKLPYSAIRDEIMTHPTLAEAIQSVTLGIPVPQIVHTKKTA